MINDKKKIKVLIFEPYPFDRESGNLKTLSHIIDYINKNEFELLIVTPFESDLIKKLAASGITCEVATPPLALQRYGRKCLTDNFTGKLLSASSLLRYWIVLIRIIKRRKIDIVYCNGIRSIMCIGGASWLSGKPVFWYIKGELQNKLLDAIGFVIASKIAFQCETNRDDKYPLLRRLFKDKLTIVKSGIDLSTILETERMDKSAMLEELSIRSDKTNIAVLGQVYPLKGIHYLLDAYLNVVKRFPDVQLYVIGDHIIEEYRGYAQDLIEYAEEHKILDKVYFTGWRQDALSVLSVMDILVHPSLSEGMPRAVLEAMAFGKTVIATKVGGTREVIEDNVNGFFVDPKNSSQIAEKLCMLLSDSHVRLKVGKAARKTIFTEYIIQDSIAQLERLWSSMYTKQLFSK